MRLNYKLSGTSPGTWERTFSDEERRTQGMEVLPVVRATWGRERSASQGQEEDEVPNLPGNSDV